MLTKLAVYDHSHRCTRHDGDIVTTRRNVPLRYGTNLCKQSPVIPSKCAHPHGMLMNLQGAEASNLYHSHVLRHRDELVAKTGAGLFVNGGNPIYYTAKGTSDDVAKDVQVIFPHGLLFSVLLLVHALLVSCSFLFVE
jgi:hypothetical protein